jgi:ligand-binding sensor domain-containing protein
VPGPVHALVATRNGALLAGTTFGCFKWRPDDRMWLPVQSAPPMRMVRAMIQHPTGAIVVATDGLGIFVSFDEGMTWTSANDGLSVAKVLSLAVGGDGLLYAGTSEGAFKAAM